MCVLCLVAETASRVCVGVPHLLCLVAETALRVCVGVPHVQNMSIVLARINPDAYEFAGLSFQYFGAGGDYCKYFAYIEQRNSYSFPAVMREALGEPPKSVRSRTVAEWGRSRRCDPYRTLFPRCELSSAMKQRSTSEACSSSIERECTATRWTRTRRCLTHRSWYAGVSDPLV